MDIQNLTTFVSVSATLLSLILAFIGLYSSYKANKELEEIKKLHNENTGMLSTQFIGTFPDSMSKISQLIKNAKKSISIACDLPFYGVVSKYEIANHILDHLRDSKDKLKVDYIINNIITTKNDMDHLEKLMLGSDDQTKQNRWKEKKKEFLRNFSFDESDTSIFLDSFLKVQINQINNMQSISYRACSNKLLVYYWIIDDVEAIFAVSSSDPLEEIALYTRDQSIIKVLKNIRSVYHESSTILKDVKF